MSMIGGPNLGFGQQGHQAPMSEINTTPLVDVMLVLLVIFIITAPLLTHAVKIDLPQASSQPVVEKPEVIDLAIDKTGQYFWNDQAITSEGLVEKFKTSVSQQPQPELHIRADLDTRYQVLAEIMAQAQQSGLTKIGFISTPQEHATGK